MEKVFLNLTNHTLNDEQLEALRKEGFVVVEKEELFDEDIVAKLKQSPDNLQELSDLACTVAEKIREFAEGREVKLHLPIGSPLFQNLLFLSLVEKLKDLSVSFAFSHTKRIVEEQNGVKKSIFKFEKFITVSPKDVKNFLNC